MDSININKKLFSFAGQIDQKNFLYNTLCICIISYLLFLPQNIYFLYYMETAGDYFSVYRLLSQAPILLKLWYAVTTIICALLYTSNVTRRVNDINGQKKKITNIILSVIVFILNFSALMPVAYIAILQGIKTIINLILFFKKGKISENIPYSPIEKFNWGAFLGTWIWGLINKCYKPLWMLLLWLTPMGFYFSIICGLKGNKWAYKNKNIDNEDDFHTKQEKQTLAFIILNFVIIPIMSLILSIFLLIPIAVSQSTNKSNNFVENLLSGSIEIISYLFDGYEILNDENRFYINPIEWKSMTYDDRKSYLDIASQISAIKRMQNDSMHRYTKLSELSRTKIYNKNNKNEILAEFNLDTNAIYKSGKRKNYAQIAKTIISSYKFYNPK